MGKKLSEDEVQKALDFCVNIFSPTTPEQHESVRRKILESHWVPDEHDEHDEPADSTPEAEVDVSAKTASRLLDIRSPIIDPSSLTRLLKSRLSIFTRTNSSSSIKSVKSVASSNGSPPASPVSATFSFLSSISSSSFGESGAAFSEGVADSDADGEDDSEVKMVLEKVNARRVIHAEFSQGVHSLEQEAVGGMLIRLKRGELGLRRVDSSDELDA